MTLLDPKVTLLVSSGGCLLSAIGGFIWDRYASSEQVYMYGLPDFLLPCRYRYTPDTITQTKGELP